MSDTENVSVEVRELLELVLKEPIHCDETVTVSTNKQDALPTQSMDVQPEVELPRKDFPIVTESRHISLATDSDLRGIESNALKLIAQYGSDSDSVESDDDTALSDEVVAIDDVVVVADDVIAIDDVEVVLQKTVTHENYRVVSSDSEDSTSSDDSDVEVISIQNEIINLDDDDLEESDPKSRGPIRVEGEFTIDSLPPIEDLKISVPEDECVVLGKVMSIVDQLVVVDSLPGSRPIDIDSVLFLQKGTKPLGHVFDVLGNISSPMYCVRFNSNKQILDKGITVGSLVYVAPRTEHTSFVIVSDLMKQKGCDASWKNDIEPMNAQDFSDDEEERKARRMRRGRNNSTNEGESVQTVTPSQNDNNQRNDHGRTPRRRRGNFNRGGGNNYDRNYGPPAHHSWHQNLQQNNRNSPTRHNGPMGSLPPSLLLPPPPPPPSNSLW